MDKHLKAALELVKRDRQALMMEFANICGRTVAFAYPAIQSLGETSRTEVIESIKRHFCEEMDKLK